MSILSELRGGVEALESRAALAVDADALLGLMRGLGSDDVIEVVSCASAVKNLADLIVTVGAGVIAERSSRAQGQRGIAAVRGHKNPASFVQAITGGTRGDAARAVRLGESLLDGADGADGGASGAGGPAVVTVVAQPGGLAEPVRPWHEPLRRALLGGGLTLAQHDAIMRGLGQPPEFAVEVGGGSGDAESARATAREVWSLAAAQLVADAPLIPAEELARRARQMRDVLDPRGAEERFAASFADRSFRRWTDADGRRHGHITFDDEAAAWFDAIEAAALRPRRGGPRFVASDEAEEAARLQKDPRTNHQLVYDLFLGMVRAGALADAADVFGARQPGVRMIAVQDAVGPRDAVGRLLGVAHLEDGGDALPGSVLDRQLCESGTVTVTVDACGNPLDVGREQRLFTSKQRIALAIRDGGCLWPGCTVPASYCEAHHCDHWGEHQGNTDIYRGILLCRFHHLTLHNGGWVIRRDGQGEFVLHPPLDRGAPVPLLSRSAVRWAWDPPPERRRWRDTDTLVA